MPAWYSCVESYVGSQGFRCREPTLPSTDLTMRRARERLAHHFVRPLFLRSRRPTGRGPRRPPTRGEAPRRECQRTSHRQERRQRDVGLVPRPGLNRPPGCRGSCSRMRIVGRVRRVVRAALAFGRPTRAHLVRSVLSRPRATSRPCSAAYVQIFGWKSWCPRFGWHCTEYVPSSTRYRPSSACSSSKVYCAA